MPRRPPSDFSAIEAQTLFDRLSGDLPDGPSLDERLQIVQTLRSRADEWGSSLDRWLLGEVARLRAGLKEARHHHEELRAALDELRSPPWHPGVYLGSVETDRGPAACVAHGGTVRIVGLTRDLQWDTLTTGDDVLLSRDLGLVMRKSPLPMMRAGETAVYDRRLADGRLVVKQRDEEIVVRPSGALDAGGLRPGDLVRWDRGLGLAFERLDPPHTSPLFLEDTPQEGFAAIGGLDSQIDRLKQTLVLHLEHAAVARKYKVQRPGSVLLVGPPGTGKTLMARALANWVAAHSEGGQSRFLNVKPGAWNSMWYSESERNIREAFRMARDVGESNPAVPVVMFLDEVDAIGASRGGLAMRVDDRVLMSLMAELDGLQARGNVLVVAATNRRDALDAGLARAGRLGDLVLEIPRPNMAAARAIFDKHFPEDIPWASDEHDAGGRDAIIAAAVSRLYAPNGEGEIATITFRDNARRPIHARDLVSGASIAKIARAAVLQACHREASGGQSGVAVSDVLDATVEELDSAVAALTPSNCHAFINGLPQDLGVARVEPRVARIRRAHRFVA